MVYAFRDSKPRTISLMNTNKVVFKPLAFAMPARAINV